MSASSRASAVQDFHKARQRAALEQIMARLTGKSADLLCYPDIRDRLKMRVEQPGELKDIPVDSIVGSLGRCADFTRSFLPKEPIDPQRWIEVRRHRAKWPPISVYQVDRVYFVQDGHHRVSAARQLGLSHVEAHVTQIQTKVPLSPDSDAEEILAEAEYIDFLERAGLHELRPQANLRMSVAGRYHVIQGHIEAHRHLMGLKQGRDATYEEAVAGWYDQVYLPLAEVIRDQGILQDFPGRTETDLYVWISEYRLALEDELGWRATSEAVAARLAARYSPRPRYVIARLANRLLDAVRARLGKRP